MRSSGDDQAAAVAGRAHADAVGRRDARRGAGEPPSQGIERRGVGVRRRRSSDRCAAVAAVVYSPLGEYVHPAAGERAR